MLVYSVAMQLIFLITRPEPAEVGVFITFSQGPDHTPAEFLLYVLWQKMLELVKRVLLLSQQADTS